jgi:hypothetical protein
VFPITATHSNVDWLTTWCTGSEVQSAYRYLLSIHYVRSPVPSVLEKPIVSLIEDRAASDVRHG